MIQLIYTRPKWFIFFQIFVLSLFFNINSLFGQCEVKKINLGPNMDRYSMTEQFYVNSDLQNGLSAIYFSVNFIGDKSKEDNPFIIEIVATYAWSLYKESFKPNRIEIQFPSGKSITLEAQNMTRGHLNSLTKLPEGVSSIECIFEIPLDLVELILKEKYIDKLVLYDYKEEKSIDLSKNYKGQIPEMLICVIK
jgi:hypothetical protein